MRWRILSYALVCIIVVIGTVPAPADGGERSQIQGSVPEIRPGILKGYLDQSELPNSVVLLPPPPAFGSAAESLDRELSRKYLSLSGSQRWELAKFDANLAFPAAVDIFSCALAALIDERRAPNLYILLRRTGTDAGLATYAAKRKYQRKRPFVINNRPICTPDEEEVLKKDGSYPSGHSAIGWAWALILTEIAPDRADAILTRGRAFGVSRNVCNVHWHSDVVEGRIIAAAVVARLHSNADFLAQLATAKRELHALREASHSPTRDCAAEAQALQRLP